MTEHRDQTPTPLFRRHTRRPRLTSLLDNSKAQAILLTAPAGYGKTTLAQEWLQGREHVAWYRATSASADLAAFSAGLAEVIAPIVPGAGARIRQRLRVGDTPEKAVRPLAELLAEDLAGWPDTGIIVVDDYHLVTDSTPVEDFVDWVLTLVPVRILVTTRRRPAWASARRVLYGEIMEIGAEQLAMTDEEAGRVLEDRPGESVRVLVRQAQGWPALIGLAALSASLELPEERVSDALFRYFAEEVLRREPADVQRFMLLASVPARFNTQAARQLSGLDEPEPLLERLKTADLLRETNAGELAFHPLVRDFLRKKLRSDQPDEFASRAELALEMAKHQGQWDEAVHLALDIGRSDLAAGVVGDAAGELFLAGRVETIEKWLEECGASGFQEPGAILARGQLSLRLGHFSEAATIGADLTERLGAHDPKLPQALNLLGQASVLLSDYARALHSHLRALPVSTSATDQMAALWGTFVSASELEHDDAAEYLERFQKVATDDATGRIRIGSGKIIAATHNGSFAGLWPSLEPLLALAEAGAEPMATSNFYANAACVSVGRGDYATARSISERAIRFCLDLRLEFATGFCTCQLIAAQIGLRQFRAAHRTLRELRAETLGHEDPWLHIMIQILQIKLALAQGRHEDALAALRADPRLDLPRPALGEYLGVCALAWATAGERERARSAATKARATTQTIEASFFSRYALLVSELLNATTSATEVGTELILESQRANFFDALVVAYRASPRLLSWLTDRPSLHEVVGPIMVAANDERLVEGHAVRSPDGIELAELLTTRENEVLALMAQGMSNGEIAQKLFITQSTVKVHVHHILRKLRVKSRLQAVLTARALFEGDYG